MGVEVSLLIQQTFDRTNPSLGLATCETDIIDTFDSRPSGLACDAWVGLVPSYACVARHRFQLSTTGDLAAELV